MRVSETKRAFRMRTNLLFVKEAVNHSELFPMAHLFGRQWLTERRLRASRSAGRGRGGTRWPWLRRIGHASNCLLNDSRGSRAWGSARPAVVMEIDQSGAGWRWARAKGMHRCGRRPVMKMTVRRLREGFGIASRREVPASTTACGADVERCRPARQKTASGKTRWLGSRS